MNLYNNILSVLIFLPLAGILILTLVPGISKNNESSLKITALFITLIEFIISVPIFFLFDKTNGGIQFEESLKWFPDIGISYHIGIDGISLLLVLLTTFIFPITLLSSWKVIDKGLKVFLAMILFLESALIGTFVALDMILFFVFWEAVLIPMYFIIGIWGTSRRIYAAIKFFIYTAFGSGLMLIAIMYLYFAHLRQFGFPSMDIFDLYKVSLPFDGILSPQGLCFLAFFLAFAIKVPMFPFHTWLPDAHVEAPTPGSVILAGVLLKMGTYGFIRFLIPYFPEATHSYLGILAGISLIGIIYGAMVAFVQKDLKKLVAYSS
ncbi:MAG: complex I subunit 4 family protein, partial [Thermodesulfobacteriota bacterium]